MPSWELWGALAEIERFGARFTRQNGPGTAPCGRSCWATVDDLSHVARCPQSPWSHAQPHPGIPCVPRASAMEVQPLYLAVGLNNLQVNPSIPPPSLAWPPTHKHLHSISQRKCLLAVSQTLECQLTLVMATDAAGILLTRSQRSLLVCTPHAWVGGTAEGLDGECGHLPAAPFPGIHQAASRPL